MKIYSIFILSAAYITLQSKGPGLGNAASKVATGENITHCGTSCHQGGRYKTGATITLLNVKNTAVTEYLPGKSYTVKVEPTMNNEAKYGFQSSVLDTKKAKAGTISPKSANTRMTVVNGKQYAEHNKPSATNVFEYTWVAPAKGTGMVNIYVGGAIVNGNSMTSMDNGFRAVAEIAEATSSLKTLELKSEIAYNPSLNNLMINSNSNIKNVKIYNLNGELVLDQNYQSVAGASIDLASFINGIYIVSVKSKYATDVHKFIKF